MLFFIVPLDSRAPFKLFGASTALEAIVLVVHTWKEHFRELSWGK